MFDSCEGGDDGAAVADDVEVCAELCAALDHEDAREEWLSWEVSWDPELVVSDVLDSDGLCVIVCVPDDGVEECHLSAVRVPLCDAFAVDDSCGEVYAFEVQN